MSLLGAVAARSDFDAQKWRYYREISGPIEPGFCALDLDANVMAQAKRDLSDLRVISGGTAEQPFEIRISRGESSVKPVSARMYNLSRVPGQGTRFELDLGRREKFATEVTINTRDRDFKYQVAVEGSGDSREWVMLRSDGAIFDFSGDVHSRSTLVKLPATNFPLLRVTIRDTERQRLHVTGAEVNQLISRPARRVTIKPKQMAIDITEGNRNLVELDLGSPGQPFDEVEVCFSDDNVRRPCHVATSNDPEAAGWNRIASDVIFRYRTATFVGEHSTIALPETRNRYVRVSVSNFDDEALEVTNAKLYGKARSVVFRWDPKTPVRLYYGAEEARTPKYDLSTLLQYEQVEPKASLRLGPKRESEAYARPKPPWTEANFWLLWVAMALAIIVVGGMIVRMMARVGVDQGPHDSGGS